MLIFHELDEWAYDIERQLNSSVCESRSKLQRQLMQIEKIRDRLYDLYVKNSGNGGYTSHFKNPPKYCRKRLIAHLTHNKCK